MKIDLHIHTSTGSDGAMSVEEVFKEAKANCIDCMSITDHDNIDHQGIAIELAIVHDIRYITGVELNVTATLPDKSVALDLLGYGFNYENTALKEKLHVISEYREMRAHKIIHNLNIEFANEDHPLLNDLDLQAILENADGVLGRPHIANYLINKGIVSNRQEAFDKYLIKCDVPKYPFPLAEASQLIRRSGGKCILAHPNDPNGTSLVSLTGDLAEQTKIIETNLLEYIDGIECWHSRSGAATTFHYTEFCKKHHLLMTGGSDCHQKPVLIGTVTVPAFIIEQFHSLY